jgi:hypothetical protein
LQHDPDPLAPLAVGAHGILAEHRHLAAIALAVALEDLHRRRLPRPVRAKEGEDLAAADLELDPAHRFELAVAHPQVADGYDGLGDFQGLPIL